MSAVVDLDDAAVVDLYVVSHEAQVLAVDLSAALHVQEAPRQVEHVGMRVRLVTVDVRRRLHDRGARYDVIQTIAKLK